MQKKPTRTGIIPTERVNKALDRMKKKTGQSKCRYATKAVEEKLQIDGYLK